MFSPTYVATFIGLLSQVFLLFGIEVATADLSTTINTLVTIGTAIYVLGRYYIQGRTNLAGVKK